MEEALRRTPLYEIHKALGARIVPFAGWEMPVQYAGILDETRAVRNGVGLFDISHMGRVRVKGAGALDLLQKVTSNNVGALSPGQAQYSLLTNPDGGIIDDIIVYRLREQEFALVVNASNTAKDLEWIRGHAGGDCDIADETESSAMIAVQGPRAPESVAQLVDVDVVGLDRFAFSGGEIAGVEAALLRTGYTGEDGFEIVTTAHRAPHVWHALEKVGGIPCGLGARDALRIEAGYPLYSHEIDDSTTPVEAGLMFAVSLDKADFIGRDRIAAVKESGAGRRLVGLVLRERIIPRQGYTLYVGETPVGKVTSGIFSPTVGHSIAMAYVNDPFNKTGTVVDIEIRGSRFHATVVLKKNLLSGLPS